MTYSNISMREVLSFGVVESVMGVLGQISLISNDLLKGLDVGTTDYLLV